MTHRVLLVEDDVERGQAMLRSLSSSFECRHVGRVEEAMAVLSQRHWSAVVSKCDLAGGGSGVDVLQVVRETLPRTFRLIYTEVVSRSFRDDMQRMVLPHFTGEMTDPGFMTGLQQRLEALLEPPSLELPPDLPPITTDVWVVRAPLAREFVQELRDASRRDAPVYIYGEPGTGVTRAGAALRQWRRDWKAKPGAGPGHDGLPVPILRVPALRERLQDLPQLAARCLIENARQANGPLCRLSPTAIEELSGREWFGNIVELSAVIVRALQRMGSRRVIEVEDLPRDVQPAWRPSQYAKDEGQRDCVLRQLRAARNVSAAARLEGCSRANYIRLMRRLGIIRADVVTDPSLEGTTALP